ncbi:hypothetical protein GUITHDRAFT_107897 [Guillardia theta CCMP2712]|uniref:Uncharacterized protein n=1 Tax=Guillardia theta (strain CCMP2712) TaxID=905079 RepID=L1JDX4_GUITC|nr:hypothetical protein GUITHDRAFT_107897 [Guillardia theta CCMP2712]EKX46285.1 hypothetical protein GUITHDRAFT_107897 [Guillardia theta CCMP2712]|eukprot:XP_005833265.1 hypothetical protein GUITHDRAFT_107897 [Guillardia theta CCMP2712]
MALKAAVLLGSAASSMAFLASPWLPCTSLRGRTTAHPAAVRMQLGGGGLKGLGGDPDTYRSRLMERKKKLEEGKGDIRYSPELLSMIQKDEQTLFSMLDTPLGNEEVERLKAINSDDVMIMEDDDEDDWEMEQALLEMFVEQGDVDPTKLPKTGQDCLVVKKQVVVYTDMQVGGRLFEEEKDGDKAEAEEDEDEEEDENEDEGEGEGEGEGENGE